VKIQPNNGDALLMLGEMNLDEGKLKEAREFLERAAKCGARGNYSTLLSVLEMNERLIGKGVAPVILGKPNNEVVVQTNATSVRRLDPTGLPSDAQGSLSSVLIRRNDSAAWHRLAKTICPNGLTANAPDNHAIIALRSLEKAKALNPHDPSVCADLLELYLQSHAYDLAEIECEELLKLDPSNASGLKLKPLIKRMKDLSDKGNFPASQFGH
jgi:tetratricopeptide (TPR) repeat protein